MRHGASPRRPARRSNRHARAGCQNGGNVVNPRAKSSDDRFSVAKQVLGDRLAAGSVSNNRPAGETLGLAVFTAAIALAAVGLLWASRTHARSAGA